MRARVLTCTALVTALSACGSAPRATSPTSPPPPESPTSTQSAPAGEQINVTVKGGRVTGKTVYPVPVGRTVRIEVTADVSDEVHLHGYDVAKNVSPGKPAVITFEAKIPGIFEVELEQAHQKLFEIRVS